MRKSAVLFLFFSCLLLVMPAGALAQTGNKAVLSLEPATGTFNKGCSFSLKVNLDTGGAQTDGTDAILNYDASRFNATSITTNGAVYSDYPGNNIDAQNGKITISGLASVDTPFTGKGLLATINFTVQSNAPTGATQITFDFDPLEKGSTRDSNVVERFTIADVLNSVVNGSYTVGTGSCVGQTTPALIQESTVPVGQGSVIVSTPSAKFIPIKTLPEGGTPQLTSALAIVGLSLTILGILGLAIL